jgi:hypothetical protein
MAGKLRDAVRPPLMHSGRERLLGSFFRNLEVPDKANQGCHDPPPVSPVDLLDCPVGVCWHIPMVNNVQMVVDSSAWRSIHQREHIHAIYAADLH